MHPRRSPVARACVAALFLSAAPAALADSLDELRGLVGGNDAQAAWAMAQRMAPEASGDVEFDFWYALAARAAGQKNESLFAFERVLAAQPDNARARLELAELEFQYGNHAEARRLFGEVLADNPPDTIQQRIRASLAAIDAGERNRRARVNYVLGVAVGHDSNIGSATDIANQDDILPGFVLLPQSLATDAMVMDLRAGLELVAPVNQRTLRFLAANLQRRDNEDFFAGGNFDNTQFSVSGGWLLKRGTAAWRIPLGVQALWAESLKPTAAPVNDDRYLFTVGVEYSRPLSARTGWVAFARIGSSHVPSSPDRNAQLALAGLGWNWSAAQAPVTVSTTLHVGTEPTEDSTLPAKANGKDYVALRAGVRWSFTEGHALHGGLGWQDTQYQAAAPVLPSARQDQLLDFSVGWQWQVDSRWTVNADVSVAQNDSQGNTLFDFDRTQARLGSTWRF